MVPANICCQVEPDTPVSETRPQASSETGEGTCEADGKALAHLLALCGNSLLKPMSRDAAYGLSPSFWRELSVDHPNKTVDAALCELAVFAEAACAARPVDKAVERVNTEFARLFIGPPRPAAPPWQTMYEGQATSVGMGRPAFEMKQQLRLAQLELGRANAQYEDHVGIELLLAAVLVERGEAPTVREAARSFARRFPLSWTGRLEQRVRTASPCGYYAPLVKLARGALEMI